MLRSESLATYLHNLPSFLTYTSNWFVYPWGAGPGLPPSRVVFVAAWSLATEEQFYLFWPWVLAFSKRWFTPLLVMFALIAVNEIIKVRFGYWFFLSGHSLPVTILNSISTAICMGCLVAIVLNRASGYKAASRIFGQSWSVPLFVAIMLFVCVVPNDDTLHVLRMFYICAAMAAALTACIMRPDHLLKPLFVNPVMKYIGTISYGMYLYHAFGINIADRLFGFSKSWPLLQFVVVTATTVGIASVSYWTFEKFFLRLKSKFSSRTYKEQPPTEVVPAVAS